ncbi:WhiB family transcriptional regulator [Streptomyces prasinopilosus]|uniref:WhiB family transcriptional regulator n=1 Tax=Streptomyces prasinopilosus TaxID=67344 RepID=UPI0006EB8C85|nr:WhiB family transcriptional regulator [Streptomyces prasinopilosus]
MSRYAWMTSALCAQVDPDEWIDNLAGGGSHTARRICQRCPVTAACAAHAVALEQHDGGAIRGIWGGTSQNQRRKQKQLGEAA